MEKQFNKKQDMLQTHIIIMAGGIGSRLWPISTPEYPKQFIDVLGKSRSLIQLTVERFLPLCPIDHFWVVTSERYLGIVREQLPELPEDHILLEPEPRNTAPCIAYACWRIKKSCPRANIVVTPSDAYVENVAEFRRVIGEALTFTASRDAIVTVGIQPDRPETGYGYICAAERVDGSEICRVEAFKEKPGLATAETYLRAGNYLWNAGIFVWRLDTIEEAIRGCVPGLAEVMDRMAEDLGTPREREVVGRLFPTCEKVSIDYAVMERVSNIYTLPAEFGWSDLGSWGSLYQLLPKDEDGNACVGHDVRLFGCTGCVAHSSGRQPLVASGLRDCIIAERDGAVLICPLREEQRVKEFIG